MQFQEKLDTKALTQSCGKSPFPCQTPVTLTALHNPPHFQSHLQELGCHYSSTVDHKLSPGVCNITEVCKEPISFNLQGLLEVKLLHLRHKACLQSNGAQEIVQRKSAFALQSTPSKLDF